MAVQFVACRRILRHSRITFSQNHLLTFRQWRPPFYSLTIETSSYPFAFHLSQSRLWGSIRRQISA